MSVYIRAYCYLCNNKQLRRSSGPSPYSLHRFPRDPITLSLWLQVCDLTERDNVSTLKICSDHFVPSDFVNPIAKQKGGPLFLKFGAVPSIKVRNPCVPPSVDVTLPQNSEALECLQEQDIIIEQEISIEDLSRTNVLYGIVLDAPDSPETCAALIDPLKEEPIQEPEPLSNTFSSSSNDTMCETSKRKFVETRYVADIIEPDFSNPEKAKKYIAVAKGTIENQAKKIKNLREENRRLQKQLASMNEILKCLPKSEIKSEENTDT